jgi:hypothetical protein
VLSLDNCKSFLAFLGVVNTMYLGESQNNLEFGKVRVSTYYAN